MSQRSRFRAHMLIAAASMALSMGAAAEHLAYIAIGNALLFGVNLLLAWEERP